MVIDWERVAVVTGKSLLLILEFFAKISAVLVAGVVLAAQGSFGTKLGAGYSSLSVSLRKFFQAPSEISGAAAAVNEYHSLAGTPAAAETAHQVMTWLHGTTLYMEAVSGNLSNEPLITLTAALIAFVSVYLVSAILRFYRQKGEGSWLTKLERELSEKVFVTPAQKLKEEMAKRKAAPAQAAAVKEKPQEKEQTAASSAPRSFRAAQNDNKFLQDYIRLAQNGGG